MQICVKKTYPLGPTKKKLVFPVQGAQQKFDINEELYQLSIEPSDNYIVYR
jgi:hypothetical protein